MSKNLQEIEKITYIGELKKKLGDDMESTKSAEQIKSEIAEMCVKCFLPASEDCEICNGSMCE